MVYITGTLRPSLAWQTANAPQFGAGLAADERRFWTRVLAVGSCWEWQGGRLTRAVCAYGQLSWRGQVWRAHRVAWLLANGPIPAGRHVLHTCDNPLCCNPAHLFLGDQSANMKDAARKGRLNVPRPKRQKVTDAQVAQIRSLAQSGVRNVRLAEQFGVSKSLIGLLVSGKRRQFGKVAA
jgi:hypothetical protein